MEAPGDRRGGSGVGFGIKADLADHGVQRRKPCWRGLGLGLLLAWSVGTLLVGSVAAKDDAKVVGRPVKVATIAIGFGGQHDAKLKLALEHLATAGQQGVDIASLPEEFAGMEPEPVPGPTTQAIAELARRYGMYVICPLREQAGDRHYNTAVLLDRQGKVAGYYRKVFVFWGEGLHCSTEGVKVFQTDFGKISLLTCFDLNFPELWQQCDELGAEIVFWPSAYAGGSPLSAFATLYHYYVVPIGDGTVIDVTGQPMTAMASPRPSLKMATLDLDRTFVHVNFNEEKIKKLTREHAVEIEIERDYPAEGWWLLRALKPGVSVRELCRQYAIETLRDYQHRSRRQIHEARGAGRRI
jgi:beta-ureidopropionase